MVSIQCNFTEPQLIALQKVSINAWQTSRERNVLFGPKHQANHTTYIQASVPCNKAVLFCFKEHYYITIFHALRSLYSVAFCISQKNTINIYSIMAIYHQYAYASSAHRHCRVTT